MIREGQNYAVIEGILSEVDLGYKPYKKNGVEVEAIGGSIKVKVSETINGEKVDLDIPVFMFSGKLTNKGGDNPAYASIEKVMNEFKSIAAVGEEEADRIRITGAKVTMNEYYSPDGRLVRFPRIQASFVTKIKAEDCKPRATWEIELYIAKMGYQTDKDGIETDKYEIQGVNVGWAGKADIIPVITSNKKIAEAIAATYADGDTVPMSGKLNFSSSTETVMEEVEIGDPVEKVRTVNVSELIITGLKGALAEGYTDEEIQQVLADRTTRLEASKQKAATAQPGEKKAPPAKGKVNLGF